MGFEATKAGPEEGSSGGRQFWPPLPIVERRPARRWFRRGLLGVALLVVAYFGWSVVGALSAADSSPFPARWVEWVRDHGGSGVVTLVERFWYSHHQPPKGGRPVAGAVPETSPATVPPSPRSGHLLEPQQIQPIVQPPLFAEGSWQAAGRPVDGIPGVFTSWLRPDAVHTSVVAGVAWLDPTLLEAKLFAGTQEPGGSGWAYTAPVSPSLRPDLVATFNSGFRLKDAGGGYFAEGHLVKLLVDGMASFVIYKDGTATVGLWGRDVAMAPAVSAVRQNLPLIVDKGAPVPGLSINATTRWGFTVGNQEYVWRSGLGVTGTGALVYVAGPYLSIETLADALARVGALRAMELDINTNWVDFFSYAPAPGLPSDPSNASKLLPNMFRSTQRYFEVDARDFIGMFARGPQSPPPRAPVTTATPKQKSKL